MNYSIFKDTMADMNWKEIEAKGKEKIPVLFPLGVIEEHGPHLPLGTDIYFSYAVSRKIKEALNRLKTDCLIAPPFYWGINHCTGAFPGTFSVKPETMKSILFDIFENLHRFGFNQVYCVNYHGDARHVATILEAIKAANVKFHMSNRLLIEEYELQFYSLSGEEDYILVNHAEFPTELFEDEDESEKGLMDIHAGAFETAAMNYFYPEAVQTELAAQLKSSSLSDQELSNWLSGGEVVRDTVPLGYAGNPAGYEKLSAGIETVFNILSEYYAKRIMELQEDNDKK